MKRKKRGEQTEEKKKDTDTQNRETRNKKGIGRSQEFSQLALKTYSQVGDHPANNCSVNDSYQFIYFCVAVGVRTSRAETHGRCRSL